MNSKFTFLAIVLFSISSFGQYKYDSGHGFKFITKSENYLKTGNLDKAKKYIKKARKSDFQGGNPEATAKSRINLIEAQILIRQKLYDEALTLLDTTHGASFGVNCPERDSLKIAALFSKYGKEKVKASFKNIQVIKRPDIDQFDTDYCAFNKELNYNFCFYTDYEILNDEKTKINFQELAKDQIFYKLLE
ncbi:MAG: hypothetical protein PSV16_11110 [Flavobacterium sp.]|nr:hypothetical protein [Flavobacterium sp.]